MATVDFYDRSSALGFSTPALGMSHSIILLRLRQTEITGLTYYHTGRHSVKRIFTTHRHTHTQTAAKALRYTQLSTSTEHMKMDPALLQSLWTAAQFCKKTCLMFYLLELKAPFQFKGYFPLLKRAFTSLQKMHCENFVVASYSYKKHLATLWFPWILGKRFVETTGFCWNEPGKTLYTVNPEEFDHKQTRISWFLLYKLFLRPQIIY